MYLADIVNEHINISNTFIFLSANNDIKQEIIEFTKERADKNR